MAGATIEFYFDSIDDEHRFIRSYLVEAWDRFQSGEFWEHGWFWPYGHFGEYDVGVEGGELVLVFEGDPNALITAEAEFWDDFDGLASWRCLRYDDPTSREEWENDPKAFPSLLAQQEDRKGAVGGSWEYKYKALTAEFALRYFDTFEELLPPTPDQSDQNPIGLGFWSLLHALIVQCGYDTFDETELYLQGMQSRLRSLALYIGEEAAREEYDRILSTLQAFEGDLEAWIDEHETGTETI